MVIFSYTLPCRIFIFHCGLSFLQTNGIRWVMSKWNGLSCSACVAFQCIPSDCMLYCASSRSGMVCVGWGHRSPKLPLSRSWLSSSCHLQETSRKNSTSSSACVAPQINGSSDCTVTFASSRNGSQHVSILGRPKHRQRDSKSLCRSLGGRVGQCGRTMVFFRGLSISLIKI